MMIPNGMKQFLIVNPEVLIHESVGFLE